MKISVRKTRNVENYVVKVDDEVVILTHSRNLAHLKTLFLNQSKNGLPTDNEGQDEADN